MRIQLNKNNMLNNAIRSINEIKPLVILGAGASYDLISEVDVPEFICEKRPLLANNLFGHGAFLREVQGCYPAIGSLIGRLRKVMKSSGLSLEEAMGREHDDSRQTKDQFNKNLLNLQNYLQDLFLEISIANSQFTGDNYSTFFDCLRRVSPSFMVVNFNYDFLAQKAIENLLGVTTERIDDYLRHDIKLIHPHGSVLWYRREKENPYIDEEGYIHVKKIREQSTSGVRRLFDYSDLNKNLVIMPPMAQDKKFACPDFHLKTLERYLLDVNVVIIIGWQGREDHFKESLKSIKNLKKVIVVGGSEDKESGRLVLENSGLSEIGHFELIYVQGFSNLLEIYPDFSVEPRYQHRY